MPRERFTRMDDAERDVVLDAAEAAFAEHGYHAASLNALLKSIEMSKGSFYHAFEDKADLYGAVVTRLVTGVGQNFSAPRDSAPEAFWSDIESALSGLYAGLGENPVHERLARDAVRMFAAGTLPEPVTVMVRAFDAVVLEVIGAGQRAGAIRTDVPTPLIAQMLLGAGAAVDVWVAENVDDFGAAMPLVSATVEMLRRMVAPAGA